MTTTEHTSTIAGGTKDGFYAVCSCGWEESIRHLNGDDPYGEAEYAGTAHEDWVRDAEALSAEYGGVLTLHDLAKLPPRPGSWGDAAATARYAEQTADYQEPEAPEMIR